MSCEKVEIKDSDGNVFRVWKYEDTNFPILPAMGPSPNVRLPDVMGVEGKDGDVVLCSFPKTGTNWVFDMMTMLKNNKAEVSWALSTSALEINPDFNTVVNQPEPRAFVTHLQVNRLPKSLLSTAKIVLVCRNPKDSAVSLMHMLKRDKTNPYKGDWNTFFDWTVAGLPFGSFFDYYREWDETMKTHPEYRIHLVYYEDFHRDSVGTLRKLSDFLEYDRSDELLEAITEKCKIKTIQAEKEAHPFGQKLMQMMTNDGKLPFFRKGIIGDWKTHFTVAQSEMFDKLMQERLEGTVYKFQWEMPE